MLAFSSEHLCTASQGCRLLSTNCSREFIKVIHFKPEVDYFWCFAKKTKQKHHFWHLSHRVITVIVSAVWVLWSFFRAAKAPDTCREQSLLLLNCFVVTIWSDLQLPNFRGQACASIGKSSRCMGHSAWMVNLRRAEGQTVLHRSGCGVVEVAATNTSWHMSPELKHKVHFNASIVFFFLTFQSNCLNSWVLGSFLSHNMSVWWKTRWGTAFAISAPSHNHQWWLTAKK